jgi:anti-sigma factor RsiW
MESLRNAPFDMHTPTPPNNKTNKPERLKLEALLANDPQARALNDMLRKADDEARLAFKTMLKEPVSLDLVRSIKTATPPRRAVRLPQARRARWHLRPSFSLVCAASLLMFGFGTAAGYMVAGRPHMVTYGDMAGDPVRAWLDDVASYYRLYSRQTRHLVEVPASESAHIVDWLMATTGVSFRIPNLASDNLEFVGARLFSAGGRPVGQLVYRNREGEVIAVSFTKLIAPQGQQPDAPLLRQTIRDDIGLVTWQGLQGSYVLTGPSSDAELDTLAAKIAGII